MKGFFRLFLIAVVLVSGAGFSRAPAEQAAAGGSDALLVPDQAPLSFVRQADTVGTTQFFQVPAPMELGLVFGNMGAVALGGDAADGPAEHRVYHPAGDAALAVADVVAGGPDAIPSFEATTTGYLPTPIPGASPMRAAHTSGTVGRLLQGHAPAERSGWTLLLCSFVVVGFIAQRKSRLIAG